MPAEKEAPVYRVDWKGCGTALVTPFDDKGRIDFRALAKLVEWQISSGIDFLVPCGTTGESATLSGEERKGVTAAVVKAADGRVPVIAGAGRIALVPYQGETLGALSVSKQPGEKK